MPDIIELLPDFVANQIAAGEVIQRPASVVKELMENAIDSGGNSIKIIIKDSGKTLVQVIDNGCGMSETDARMAFERHATSKISSATDLFAIRTKGFRGEALASIAAVAQVNLKTRKHEEELGNEINISASAIESQEPCSCQPGSNFSVKNLFFNVPARRKFLKAPSTEFKHIMNEFQRVALAHANIAFSLYHNNTEIFNLPVSNPRQRIVHLLGKSINQKLINVDTETTIITIKGFIGKPEYAKKTSGEQYFFINGRFMRHPYFHKAVTLAYDQLISMETLPSYFIYFEADPSTIDINIHPTKTEIKFEDERAIWEILHASIKESLGKVNAMPSLDFNKEGVIDIPVMTKNTEFNPPKIDVDPEYNPFDDEKDNDKPYRNDYSQNQHIHGWEQLYAGLEKAKQTNENQESQQQIDDRGQQAAGRLMQFKNKYILTPVKSGLMIVDQKRAHERILFEKYITDLEENKSISQQNLFPQKMELSPSDYANLSEIMNELSQLGFNISDLGDNVVSINSCPADTNADATVLVENLLREYQDSEVDLKISAKENLACSLAKAAAIPYGKSLLSEEMRVLVDQLFACKSPNYSPNGKAVLHILGTEEIEKRF